jgi:hypothetical protein
VLLAAHEPHDEAVCVADDVRVGDDVAARVEDDPGAEADRCLDLDDLWRHRLNDAHEALLQARDRHGDGGGDGVSTRAAVPGAAGHRHRDHGGERDERHGCASPRSGHDGTTLMA